MWKERTYVIEENHTVHILRADLLPANDDFHHSHRLQANSTVPTLETTDIIAYAQAALDPNIPIIGPSTEDRRAIEDIAAKAQNRVVHGKVIPPPIKPTKPLAQPDPAITALLQEFADVFPRHPTLRLTTTTRR